jgi:LacI family transcriptional regulator
MRMALKPVTIRDVAREAQVSVASASRALNNTGNVTAATRERVLGAARSLRYVPHSGARSLSTRRTQTIGVVLPDLYGEFFSEVIRGVDEAARARGLHLLVSNSHGDADEAASAIRAMRGRVDGLLLMSPHVDASVLADNLSDDLPLVLMNTRIEGRTHPAFLIDNYAGAYAVTRHLVEGGAGRVAHIAGALGNFEAEERRRGYLDALQGSAPLVVQGDFSEESGHAAGLRLATMEKRPDAVFAANDMMAVGCMAAVEAAGLRVPQDIALAGFDDIPIARLIKPALTTARVRISDLGRRALERLAGVIEHPDGVDLSPEIARPELVVRESSGGKQAVPGLGTGRRH